MIPGIYKRVNEEATKEFRFEREPYEFAQKHLWIPEFKEWSTAALYAFHKDIWTTE